MSAGRVADDTLYKDAAATEMLTWEGIEAGRYELCTEMRQPECGWRSMVAAHLGDGKRLPAMGRDSEATT